MMSILNEILGAQGGAVVGQLASGLGLGKDDAAKALGALLPALMQGVKKQTASPGGAAALLGALTKGNHAGYLKDAAALLGGSGVADGNNILGHILGSKDVSRNVAANAASQTGIDVGTLKKMLPMAAGLFMGAMNKQTGDKGMLGAQASAPSSDMLSGLSSMLDFDGDGSAVDDVLNLAKKFF